MKELINYVKENFKSWCINIGYNLIIILFLTVIVFIIPLTIFLIGEYHPTLIPIIIYIILGIFGLIALSGIIILIKELIIKFNKFNKELQNTDFLMHFIKEENGEINIRGHYKDNFDDILSYYDLYIDENKILNEYNNDIVGEILPNNEYNFKRYNDEYFGIYINPKNYKKLEKDNLISLIDPKILKKLKRHENDKHTKFTKRM